MNIRTSTAELFQFPYFQFPYEYPYGAEGGAAVLGKQIQVK